ncbi:hypothetical protein U6A24_03850 [Aquimarina gracilis]|uniref:Uncharacterized protein n=1 Tax=Aquimarina gracilis TaxID=874422 RepID=A0ABU5ZR84_9FLAO|nr:hypothetical protein [Aquimarina gracilis]MEB3344579.1 hypothetical protein [Aquimarina gracilis]
MNPPFHFYPRPNVAIAIPVKTWWPKIFRNRTHYVALPLNTTDDYLKIQVMPNLRISNNILHLDFRVKFNEYPEGKKPKLEFLQYVCLKITHIPRNLSLVQLKISKVEEKEVFEPDHFTELKLDPFFNHKKYDAHFKYIKENKPLEVIETRQGIVGFNENDKTPRDFDSCTIPPK